MSSSSSLSHGKRHRRPSSADRRTGHEEPRDKMPEGRKRGGRRRKWLVLFVLAMVALVWFLPMLVAHGPLLGWIVGQATGDLNGTATLQSASLGWFSPVRASGLRVVDQQGALVVDVPEFSSDTSLAKLATNWKQLGTFTLERPTIHVVLYPDGSNIEELIANYLTGPSGEPVAVELKVVDATIHVRDQTGGQPWSIERFNLLLRTSDKKDGPFALTASGMVPGGASAGTFAVKLEMGQDDRLEVKTTGLELGKLQSLLAQFAPGVQLAGRLDAAVEGRWGDESKGADASAIVVAANLNCSGFNLECPQLANDRIHLATLRAKGRFALAGGKLVLDEAQLETDLGSASLTGHLELAGTDPAGLLDSLLRQAFVLKADVDLARVAAMLPGTLHIDQQTTITRGRLKVDLASRPTEQGMACRGHLAMSDLAAKYRGEPLVWRQPITASLDARRTDAGICVDRLDCRSAFLTLQGAGTRYDFNATAKFDLDRLAEQLQGFVDLGGVQLSGNGSAKLQCRHDAQGVLRAEASLGIHDFRLTLPQRPVWHEPHLTVSLWATGMTDFGKPARLDSAKLEVKTATEQLAVRLTEPVAELKPLGPWPLAVAAHGNLAHWTARAKAWNLLTGWDAAGTYRLTANLVGSPAGVELRVAQLMLDQARLVGGGLNLVEPTIRLGLAGRYDRAAGRVEIRQAKLECPALTLDASRVIVAMAPWELSGNVNYRGELARLQSWVTPLGTHPTWQAQGQLHGRGQLKQAAGTTTGQLDATVTQLVLQSADGRRFQEPEARLVARGSYEPGLRQLKLDELLLGATALGIRAKGQVNFLGKGTTVDLTGQLAYDWQRLVPLLQPYMGNRVNIVGRGDRPLSFRGPLDTATAEAAAAVDWSGIYAYGFQVGPGKLDARLAGGVLQCAPLDLAVSEGRLLARPRLRLSPAPALLEIEPGQILQQVRINPDMCAQGLQYIAPVLAGVAVAEGRFSIALDQCRLRLDDPAKSDVAGRLTVHSVEIGPGPLVRELAVVLRRASAAKLQRESVIRFRMIDGRVYHEGLELVFPELTVRTHGWVGVDQTLSLVAEMPIPPKWLASHRLLDAALRDQTLRVPIRGTLNRPRIDHRTLDEYNRKLLSRGARKALEGELNRQLDRLFNPKR